jgi:iron complex outermembrane receptor protein
VLLNGRRVQPGGINTEAVDLNQFPTGMIERVEVLTGGASATYGADAVAGVVNFIMRRMNGVEVSAGISAYQHDNNNKYMQGLLDDAGYPYPTGGTGFDGSSYNIEILMGGDFADGRGNATAYMTWRQNSALLQDARDYSACALGRSGLSCAGSGTAPIPNFYIYTFYPDGTIDPVTGLPFPPDSINPNSSIALTLQPDSSLADNDGNNTYNFNPTNFYLRPQTTWTAGLFADYEVNENAVVYTEIMLANSDSRAQIAFSGTFFNPIAYPVNNSLFPQTFQDSLAEFFPGEDRLIFYTGKRNVEGGPREDALTYSSFRVVAGMKGVINEDWDYDVSYLHSQSNSSSTYFNDLYGPYVNTATHGDTCAATPGCLPYNIFTYNGVTPQSAAAVVATASGSNRTTLDIVEAFVTGDTGWGLPAGNVMMAGGYQWIQTGYTSVFDEVYASGGLYGQGGPRLDVDGTIRANQLFVEASVPLLADESWAQQMTLDLAYRWSDYNTTGANSTYRFGIDWQIVDMFRVRTGYNRAVRAPSVLELFSPQAFGLWTGSDPCSTSEPELTEAQCANTGVLPGQYGTISSSPASQYNAIYGGQDTLDVETAKTFTFGIVVNPLPTMQFSVDYWDIQIDDTIQNVNPETSLTECALNGGSICDNVHRGVGGQLWLGTTGWIDSLQENIGTQKWTGIDVAWSWGLGTNWNFNMIGAYTLKREVTPIPDIPSSAYDCAGVLSPVCDPNPDWRHTASATYDSNSWWALTGRWRYIGSIDYDGATDKIADDNLGSQNYFDLSAVFRFMDTNDIVLGVNNVFDEDPPMLGSTIASNGNTMVGFYDTLGRYFFADVTFRW